MTQEEAFDIADRVVVFNRGRVEQEGEPAEVARSPASAFVMQFVSDVNTLPSASLVRPCASNRATPVWGGCGGRTSGTVSLLCGVSARGMLEPIAAQHRSLRGCNFHVMPCLG